MKVLSVVVVLGALIIGSFAVRSNVHLLDDDKPALLDGCPKDSAFYQANMAGVDQPWPHYWEECVGSGHALLALRSDYRHQLKMAHDYLGFKRVRFHGLFDDDMSVYQNINGQKQYSWYNVDSIFDYFLSIGMQPLIELSFMPEDMASGTDVIFHYKGNITPPKNWNDWFDLLVNFAQHLIERYGIDEIRSWYFETWNEPNCGFWSGNQTQYFKLLEVTSAALKSVDPQLRVGGPATCQSAWLNETLQYCSEHDVAIDFISTHEYPTDILPLTRDVMYQVVSGARETVGDMPLFYTEFNDGLFAYQLHDTSYASAFAVYNLIELQGIPDIMSWWCFSDIFEEGGFNSSVFQQPGYGLMTIYNIPKPSWRAFELLHQAGESFLSMIVEEDHPTAGLIVTRNDTHVTTLLYNHNIPDAPIDTVTMCVSFKGVQNPSLYTSAVLRRIDDTHCNPRAAWDAMGQPMYPTQSQLKQLHAAAEVEWEVLPLVATDVDEFIFTLDVPPQGVASVVFPIQQSQDF